MASQAQAMDRHVGDNPSQVLEAIESFATDDITGGRIVVHAGMTRVAASSELAQRFPHYFRPVEEGLTFNDAEAATSNPGEQRARAAQARTTTVKDKDKE